MKSKGGKSPNKGKKAGGKGINALKAERDAGSNVKKK